MEMIEVQSSQIAAIGHDGAETLRVQFRRGDLYEYKNVPAEVHAQLLEAPSIGTSFGKLIKGNPAHPFRKVGSAPQDRAPVLEAPVVVDIVGPSIASNAQVQVVAEQSGELSEQAKAIRVVDTATQERASEMLRSIAIMRGKIKQTWEPMKQAAFKAHRTVCAQETTVDAPLAEAEAILKREIGGYVAAERERVRIEEERLRREERDRAEAEAKAESERLALEQAVKLESEGQQEAAEAVFAAPVPVAPRYVPPPPVIPQVARMSGVSTREVWKYRVVNERLVPRQYLCVDEKAIGGVVRAMGSKTSIPGVEVYSDTTVSARRSA